MFTHTYLTGRQLVILLMTIVLQDMCKLQSVVNKELYVELIIMLNCCCFKSFTLWVVILIVMLLWLRVILWSNTLSGNHGEREKKYICDNLITIAFNLVVNLYSK